MKYLKLFNESNGTFNKLDMLKKDILDCFADLTDNNFEVITLDGDIMSTIMITKVELFQEEDVKETLLFAIPYLIGECGIFLENITIFYININNNINEYRHVVFDNLEDMYDWFNMYFFQKSVKINIKYTI